MKNGKLVLVPTPIDDEALFDSLTVEKLGQAFAQGNLIVVEEHKVARRKWLKNGLPREAIEEFVCLNEHNIQEQNPLILQHLKKGREVFLLSDCGLPAFCDPGQELVEMAHAAGIKVTSLPFPNSVALAVALSGFPHKKFVFEGFLSRDDRQTELKRCLRNRFTTVLMDTPYRMSKLLGEIAQLRPEKEVFIGIDLNTADELVLRKPATQLIKDLNNVNKREFVLVWGQDD